jgi:hypothetical protein
MSGVRRRATGVSRFKWGVAPNPSYFFVLIILFVHFLLAQRMGRCPKPQLLFCLDTKK